jgi:hypothetical protein
VRLSPLVPPLTDGQQTLSRSVTDEPCNSKYVPREMAAFLWAIGREVAPA